MRGICVVLACAACVLLASALGVAGEFKKEGAKEAGKKVEMTGKLSTGIVAIGGETTGTILQTKKDGTVELDFGKNKELRERAEKLNGKEVTVTGTLTVRKGVEIRVRRIIMVDSLKAAKAD